MAKKKTPDENVNKPAPPPARPSRIPDFVEGDRTDFDFPLHLAKVTVRRARGILAATLELVLDVGVVPAEGWPPKLSPLRGYVAAAQLEEGEVFNTSLHPRADVKASIVTLFDGGQFTVAEGKDARVSKLKVTAKEDLAELHVFIEVRGQWVEDMGAELLKALGNQMLLTTLPTQPRLDLKTRGKATELDGDLVQ